ncbi:MAG: enoyl-CoA hydratase/isomerase family protein [Thermodesulfobacteriota bacterium]
MDYQNLNLEISKEHVGCITLQRPEQLNTFNTPMARELNQALQEMDQDTQVRAVLLKGAGKVFCAGIDLGEFHGKSPMQYREWIEDMERPIFTISRMNKPVIAQVHGVAAANGAGLAAAADLTLAAEDARIGLTAINVGLNCVGPVIPVRRCLGRKKALELLYFGELIPAAQAQELGLFNKVVPGEELEQEANNWAAALAQKSPLALQNAKRAFYCAEDMEYDKAIQFMNEAFSRLCTTQDACEGIAAFKEKRQPQWQEK